jgi:hypothetical protein
MRRRCSLAAAGAAFLALAAGPAAATLVRSASLEETIDASDAIVVGRVVGQRAYRTEDGGIMSGIAIRVDRSLKGQLAEGSRIEISAYGGELDGQRAVALGEASYRKGERVLLLLERVDGRLQTIGLSMGKWTVSEDAHGRSHLTRDLSGLGTAGAAKMTEGPIPLDEFGRLVEERGRAR